MRIHKSILIGLLFCFFITGLFLPTASHAYFESFECGILGSWTTSDDGAWSIATNIAQRDATIEISLLRDPVH